MVNQHSEQPAQTRIVALLSEESHVPLDEVATLYEHERAALAVGPHVPNFLHVFAVRNVREMLRSRHEQAAPLSKHCAVLPALSASTRQSSRSPEKTSGRRSNTPWRHSRF